LIDIFHSLVRVISSLEGVLSIGKSGSDELPVEQDSDIDIFIFCETIPSITSRQSAVMNAGVPVQKAEFGEVTDRFWGICDTLTIAQTEFYLMYFTVTEMDNEIALTLSGLKLDREDEYFYPTGRCATFTNMHILYDGTGYIARMKNRLSVYPSILVIASCSHHLRYINDVEDFMRAVAREDVLFYHSTLETAIDHFLQALFAMNKCFFPSRKRTFQYTRSFTHKPADCEKRILQVIELGAKPETLRQSYASWCDLCTEIAKLSAEAMPRL